MPSEQSLRKFVVLGVIGAVFSAILLYHHVEINGGFQITRSFCSFGSAFDCDVVAKSQYSALAGVPIASFSLFFYLILTSLAFYAQKSSRRSALCGALFSLALIGLLPTGYMLAVSALVLKTLCLYCSVLYLVNILIGVLAWRMSERRDRGSVKLFAEGLGEILSFIVFGGLFFGKSDRSRASGVRLWVASLLVAIAIFMTPNLLEELIFVPRSETLQESQLVSLILDDWSRATWHEIAINLDESSADRDFFRGNSAAEVTMVEFSDFQCPHCRDLSSTLKSVVDKYAGKVRLVFKNYPLDHHCHPAITRPFHEFACRAAMMARCAGRQSDAKFWQMHDAIFALSEISDEQLDSLENVIGLDKRGFRSCLDAEETSKRIVEDISIGESLGIQGTPAVYINGRHVKMPSAAALEAIVESILKSGSGTSS